jgi:hypothetical protein
MTVSWSARLQSVCNSGVFLTVHILTQTLSVDKTKKSKETMYMQITRGQLASM